MATRVGLDAVVKKKFPEEHFHKLCIYKSVTIFVHNGRLNFRLLSCILHLFFLLIIILREELST